MIKIEFSGLSFFPSNTFKDVTNVNYRYIPINDHITTSSVSWNGETSIVQSIFYDAFKIQFLMRENEKQGFEKITYAPSIIVTDTENGKIISAKFLSVDFQKVEENKEFYNCTFSFADLDTKNVQNNYKENPENFFFILDSSQEVANLVLTDFEFIENYNFTQNEKNNFKDKIIDYNKLSKSFDCLLFVLDSELNDFFTALKNIAIPTTKNKIEILSDSTSLSVSGQFEILSNEKFGTGLNKIVIKVIDSNTITSNYN